MAEGGVHPMTNSTQQVGEEQQKGELDSRVRAPGEEGEEVGKHPMILVA